MTLKVSLKKSTLMIKDFIKIFIIAVAIFLVATGFTGEKETLTPSVEYSLEVKGNLGLYHTVLNEDEIQEEESEEVFSLFLGKSFIGFKEAMGFKEVYDLRGGILRY